MHTFAPSSASASTIALPIPVLPPVTMADFPFKLMVPPLIPFVPTPSHLVRYVQRCDVVRRPVCEDEREPAHHERDHGGPGEQRRQLHPGVLELAAADRCDPIS